MKTNIRRRREVDQRMSNFINIDIPVSTLQVQQGERERTEKVPTNIYSQC